MAEMTVPMFTVIQWLEHQIENANIKMYLMLYLIESNFLLQTDVYTTWTIVKILYVNYFKGHSQNTLLDI